LASTLELASGIGLALSSGAAKPLVAGLGVVLAWVARIIFSALFQVLHGLAVTMALALEEFRCQDRDLRR